MKQNRHSWNTAITILLDWLELHAEQFRLSPGEGLNSFTHIKPLGELALILYSFRSPDFRSEHVRLNAYLEKAGAQVHAFAETWGASIDWKQVPACIGESPEKGAALLIFPVAAQVSGNSSMWGNRVRDVFLQSVVAPVFGQVDVLFAKDLAGMTDCRELTLSLLLETLELPEEKRMQTSTLYLITHYVFFATKMGHRPLDLTAARREKLCVYLQAALERKLSVTNYDLTAELLLCLHWLGVSDTMAASAALDELAAVICATGFIPGEHDGKVKNGNAFGEHYHACLVTLAALGHAKQPGSQKTMSMSNEPENASAILRKELEDACSDLNHLLGNEAAITPEQLVAHFAVPEKREQLSEPGLGADEILERMQQNEPAENRRNKASITSAELVATGLTAFRKWALAGFSLADTALREKRLATCKACPFFGDAPETFLYQAMNAGNICMVCGCSVDKKVRLSTENCPSPHPGNTRVSRWEEDI